MIRSLALIGITGFWLTTMSLHIQKEFFEFNPIQTAYEILPLGDSYERDEHQNVYIDNYWIGFRQNLIGIPKSDEAAKKLGEDAQITDIAAASAELYKLSHTTYLTFRLLGRENEMLVKGTAELDSKLYLKDFKYLIKSQDYHTQIEGKVTPGGIEITINDKNNPPVKQTLPSPGRVLHSESIDFIWTPKNLSVGRQGNLKIWNPVLLSVEDIHFRVGPKEMIRYDEKDVEVFVIYFKRGAIETRSWIKPEGIVLRSETPTGLMVEKRPAWEIYDSLRTERAKVPDLPNLYSVTPDKTLPNILELNYLKVKLKTKGKESLVEVQKENITGLEEIKWPLSFSDPSLIETLKPTEFVQSKNEEIQAKARKIIGGEKSLLKAALLIQSWLHHHMTPSPTSSIPSAQQVLYQLKGDCNEYTVLFTALARAVGIPTKMIAGLMYHEGRFFYHAWPQIHLGKWISLDPTLNQMPTDVGHIPLIEGNLQNQIQLANSLGELEIEILEAH